ncbi:hypothetical protein CL658_01850 [bacterium]|nr:hypothetical protein [bacterium]
MTNKIIIISLYKNDYEVFKEHLQINYKIDYYDNAKDAINNLECYKEELFILLSTNIADIPYEEVTDQLLTISENYKIIIYSSFSSIEAVNTSLDKGVYDFIIGDDVISKVILAINSIFKKPELPIHTTKGPHMSDKRDTSIFEMIEYMRNKDDDKGIKEIIRQYDKWYSQTLDKIVEGPIMIIEDEDVFRKLLVDIVSNHYSNITSVDKGLEGVDAIKKSEFAVVIIDLFLSDSDGVELIRVIKSYNPIIQIIVVTAFDLVDVASNVLKIGVSDYLQKPIIKKDLLSAISKAQKRYKEIVIQKKAINEFFCHHLDFEQKHSLLEGLFKFKKEIKTPFLMEDLYQVFPDLNNKNIYEKIELPPILTKENIKRFISSFKLD